MVKTLTLALLLALAACQTSKGSFCQIAKPIRPSSEIIDKLSDHDVKQLLAHNLKGAKLCGWRSS